MSSKLCTTCNETKDLSSFNKNKSKPDGLQDRCRICDSIHSRAYYKANREKQAASIAKSRKIRMTAIAQYVYELKKQGCVDCGENDPCCLDFDHLGDKLKPISIMLAHGHSLEKVKEEIAKCQIRCANCHRKKTSKDQNWYARLDTGVIED